MTAVIGSSPPRVRAYLDVVATCAALAFLLLIVHPAYEYAYEESFITTPALQISNTWRAAALPVGFCLMAVFAVLRLDPDRRSQASACGRPVGRGGHRPVLAGAALSAPARQHQSRDLLRRRGRLLRVRGRADRLRVWTLDLRLSGADHADAADGAGRADGRRHEPSDPALGAAVRVLRAADRDDRHGARHGGVPCEPARPCQGRPALRAGRRDVSGVGHFRIEGRRHGCRRAGAVSGDEGARRQARRPRGAARRNRRADRNHPAEPGADHHRLGHRRLDLGAVHRRPVAGRRARDHAVGAGLVALPQRGFEPRQRARAAARSPRPSSSPCPPSPFPS